MIVLCNIVQRAVENVRLLPLVLDERSGCLCADRAEKVADFIKIIERAELRERICIKERKKRNTARGQELCNQGQD